MKGALVHTVEPDDGLSHALDDIAAYLAIGARMRYDPGNDWTPGWFAMWKVEVLTHAGTWEEVAAFEEFRKDPEARQKAVALYERTLAAIESAP